MFLDIWSGLLDIGDNGGDVLNLGAWAIWDQREMKRTAAAEELIVDYVEQ